MTDVGADVRIRLVCDEACEYRNENWRSIKVRKLSASLVTARY